MADLPSLTCPACARPLEYHATIEMLDPPIGKIDTGYCTTCARLFERVRQGGAPCEPTRWPPLCRECKQPVVCAGLGGDGVALLVHYACLDHPHERWTWAGDRWQRAID